jgi:hypothetical protein
LRSGSSRSRPGGSRASGGAPGDPGSEATELVPGFAPENDLERALIADPELIEGLAWGRPRAGHPEGSVGAHVADLLATIDRWGETGQRRSELRFLALVHDSLKFRVQNWLPKIGPNHHAMRARRFAERYTDDERLLATIEHHDRPYALWRKLRRTGRVDEDRLRRMIDSIPDPALFARFVKLDGSTEGKNPEPIAWLEEELRRRGKLAPPGRRGPK